MQKVVKITHVGETKSGVSQKDGQPWQMTDICIKWLVENPGRESYEQSCVATVRGEINREVLDYYCKNGKEVMITMYVKARAWNDKFFTQVDAYLPKDMVNQVPL